MTTLAEPTPPAPAGNHLALWAGLTTLFTNLAALNVLALLGDETNPGFQAIAALITALATAGAVYARQRMTDEKARRRPPGRYDPPDA
jgi:hypothetical protein